MKKANKINAAIARLASLFEFGALQAATDPAAFLNRVSDDFEALRAGFDRYATHDPVCAIYWASACSCGLDAARERLAKKETT